MGGLIQDREFLKFMGPLFKINILLPISFNKTIKKHDKMN